MHKILLTALAAAILFAIGMPAGRAGAMAAPTVSLAGGASSSLVREAAIVCGSTGCNPVHTKSEKRSKFKPLEYTKPVGKAS
jgi:hypothetical protein